MLLLLVQTWLVDGLVPVFRVWSGSMAPRLCGPHRRVRCLECGRNFNCEVATGDVSPTASCPHCGYPENRLADLPDLPGDRLWIDKAVFLCRSPRRWETIAFRHPQQGGRICVKRVVGLPAESVEIRHGDLYIDGRIVRKTLAQQRMLAVPVYEAQTTGEHDSPVPPRWAGQSPSSQWEIQGGWFAHPAPATGGDRPGDEDWLRYSHRVRLPGDPDRSHPSPITNWSAYSQTRLQPSDSIHAVPDILLSFFLAETKGDGELLVRLGDGRSEFEVVIAPEVGLCQAYALTPSRRLLAKGAFSWRRGALLVEVSLFDAQLLLALDGTPLIAIPFDPGEDERRPGASPIALGVRGLGVKLENLRLSRDVYYTQPLGGRAGWGTGRPAILSADEYFVLGDNSAISEDSRIWFGGPGVPRKSLIGRPFFSFAPLRPL